jgi:hypothetical protein
MTTVLDEPADVLKQVGRPACVADVIGWYP